jgi:hypothetical protein
MLILQVFIDQIPKDATDPDEFRAFLARFGEVADVTIGLNNGRLMKLFNQHAQKKGLEDVAIAKFRISKLLEAQDAVKKIEKERLKIEKEIVKLRNKSDYKSVCAFVTFNEYAAAKRCIREYDVGFIRKLFMRRSKRLRGKHVPRVKAAPNPLNVNWENLQYNDRDHSVRSAFTLVVTILLLIASFLIILISKGLKQNLTLEGGSALCYDAPTAKEDITWTRYSEGEATFQAYLACFCKTRLQAEQEFCNEYLLNQIRLFVVQAMTILSVVIINVVLKIVLVKLALFEKHHTVTRECCHPPLPPLVCFLLGFFLALGVFFYDVAQRRRRPLRLKSF